MEIFLLSMLPTSSSTSSPTSVAPDDKTWISSTSSWNSVGAMASRYSQWWNTVPSGTMRSSRSRSPDGQRTTHLTARTDETMRCFATNRYSRIHLLFLLLHLPIWWFSTSSSGSVKNKYILYLACDFLWWSIDARSSWCNMKWFKQGMCYEWHWCFKIKTP